MVALDEIGLNVERVGRVSGMVKMLSMSPRMEKLLEVETAGVVVARVVEDEDEEEGDLSEVEEERIVAVKASTASTALATFLFTDLSLLTDLDLSLIGKSQGVVGLTGAGGRRVVRLAGHVLSRRRSTLHWLIFR